MFIYVVADEKDCQVSPLQIVMAPDIGTAKSKLLELGIHPDYLWIMEFPKGN